ncbi:acetyl-CoA carboxylase biotin carboxyl carrier protein [candidate division KSB1 bacterium]|nr:acetyl-CoA carboxylase biotin carboxyl carrier protein [candidate division KSB1 bacterium]
MDLNVIKKLVKLVENSEIDELEVQDEGLQIRISKGKSGMMVSASQPMFQIPQSAQPAPIAVSEPVLVPASAGGSEILSPMVGTFYQAPAPDANAFVKEGDSIQVGQVLCIIEAMKLMNEIESEVSGKILKILVENGQAVEFNQPLFLIEKA